MNELLVLYVKDACNIVDGSEMLITNQLLALDVVGFDAIKGVHDSTALASDMKPLSTSSRIM